MMFCGGSFVLKWKGVGEVWEIFRNNLVNFLVVLWGMMKVFLVKGRGKDLRLWGGRFD